MRQALCVEIQPTPERMKHGSNCVPAVDFKEIDSAAGQTIIEPMNLTVSQTGDTQVFALTGMLDTGSAPEFERLCAQEIKRETRTLVLDLTGLEYLSSAGLQSILAAGKTLQAQGGKVVLCVAKGLIQQIIEGSGFHKLFQVCTSVEEAGKFSTGTFRLVVHKEWEVDVMTVFGRIDAERAPELEAAGRKVLTTPYQKLLINLSAVDYLSSAGLCALLNLAKLAQAQHGRLFVCCPSAAVQQVLKLSGFDKILAVRDSLQSALVE
jgi:anti-anti-sigma factor